MDRNTRCKKADHLGEWHLYDDGDVQISWGIWVLHWVAYIAIWTDTNSSVCFVLRISQNVPRRT